jgi:hypothetical protein
MTEGRRTVRGRWSEAEAWEWYWTAGLQQGFNYVPRNCVNTTEQWQSETFDATEINWELGIARSLGYTSVRVFLQFLIWEHDPAGFERRFDTFLSIAAGRGLSTVPVIFDDCRFSGRDPFLGPQDKLGNPPANRSWTPSPGHALVTDARRRPALAEYVENLTGKHRRDHRILMWDLYNEPGNSGMGDAVLPLLDETFDVARQTGPTQPLTAGAYRGGGNHQDAIDTRCAELSDVISFHAYNPESELVKQTGFLLEHRRPLLCTEWMARPHPQESRIETHLEVFRRFGVSYYNWGLVNGRTRTQYPWNAEEGSPEPEEWFHDIARHDGSPYRSDEWYALRAAKLRSPRH